MPVSLINNAILNHKLGLLRQEKTKPEDFRNLVGDISIQLFYEAAKDLSCIKVDAKTPFAETEVDQLKDQIALISIMRAGNGMLDTILRAWPDSSVGHVGIYRDKFLKNTVEYYFKVPKKISNATVFVLDPIIATGDTALACVSRLKEFDCKDIRFLSILTSTHGRNLLMKYHPEVKLYSLSDTDELTDKGYLTPGIGDVGRRYYNTQ